MYRRRMLALATSMVTLAACGGASTPGKGPAAGGPVTPTAGISTTPTGSTGGTATASTTTTPETASAAALPAVSTTSRPATGAAALSDEFDATASLKKWTRYEPAPAVFESLKVDAGIGALRVKPSKSVWYNGERGLALLKVVDGDFMVTLRVRADGRVSAHPATAFSLVGVVMSAHYSAAEKAAGALADWVYLTTGSDEAGDPVIDSKFTIQNASDYIPYQAAWGWVELRAVRVGDQVTHLWRPDGGQWRVVRTMTLPRLPAVLDVGPNFLTAFNGDKPNLDASVDYIRFAPVTADNDLQTKLYYGKATDAEVLAAFGK
ncbi:MAG: hypothetical protein QOG52_1694 [Frankiaceae bacterium]|nr:hypothetical protein [Frankiaceae bacterium]